MHIVLLLTLIGGVIIIRLSSSNKNSRKLEAIFSGIVIFIYAALRKETVGIDLPKYVDNFIKISSWTFSDILYHPFLNTWSRDPFFWIIMKLLTIFSVDPQIMIIAVSAIVAISVSILIYRSKSDVLFCFLIFICLRFYFFTLTGLRQAVAMSVLYFAIKYLETKKIVPFIIITLIASAFHASAIIFLLAYPVMMIKKTKYIFIISTAFAVSTFIFSGSFPVIISFMPLLNDRFSHYTELSQSGSGNVISSIYLLVLFFALVKQKQIREFILNKIIRSQTTNKNRIEINANITMHYNFLILGTMFSFIGIFFPGLFRIAYFFLIPSLFVLLPPTTSYYQKITGGIPIKFIVIVLLIFQFIIIGPGSGTENYMFFWE